MGELNRTVEDDRKETGRMEVILKTKWCTCVYCCHRHVMYATGKQIQKLVHQYNDDPGLGLLHTQILKKISCATWYGAANEQASTVLILSLRREGQASSQIRSKSCGTDGDTF